MCKKILMYIFLHFEQILKRAHDWPTPLHLECTQRILEGLSAQVIKVTYDSDLMKDGNYVSSVQIFMNLEKQTKG